MVILPIIASPQSLRSFSHATKPDADSAWRTRGYRFAERSDSFRMASHSAMVEAKGKQSRPEPQRPTPNRHPSSSALGVRSMRHPEPQGDTEMVLGERAPRHDPFQPRSVDRPPGFRGRPGQGRRILAPGGAKPFRSRPFGRNPGSHRKEESSPRGGDRDIG